MIHAGILDGKPVWTLPDVLTLALTPGIPPEWVIGAGKFRTIRASELKRLIRDATPEDHARAQTNAASITTEDGWAMLENTPPAYRHAMPLYAQLYLQLTDETDAAIGKRLGVHPSKILRWRTTINFDPLTGVRL
jgi:hypothetical protein